MDPTATFLDYDELSKTFTIDKSATTNQDLGVYYTWITLVDSYDNRSQKYAFVLEVLENTPFDDTYLVDTQEEDDEEIVDNDLQFSDEAIKEINKAQQEAFARQNIYRDASLSKPTIKMSSINMKGEILLEFSNEMYIPTNLEVITGRSKQ